MTDRLAIPVKHRLTGELPLGAALRRYGSRLRLVLAVQAVAGALVALVFIPVALWQVNPILSIGITLCALVGALAVRGLLSERDAKEPPRLVASFPPPPPPPPSPPPLSWRSRMYARQHRMAPHFDLSNPGGEERDIDDLLAYLREAPEFREIVARWVAEPHPTEMPGPETTMPFSDTEEALREGRDQQT